jgi:hypothetical protein
VAHKRRKRQDSAEELKKLRRALDQQRRELSKAQKKLLLCLKECVKKLEHPPWHYGPKCPTGGSGGGH